VPDVFHKQLCWETLKDSIAGHRTHKSGIGLQHGHQISKRNSLGNQRQLPIEYGTRVEGSLATSWRSSLNRSTKPR